MYYAALGLQGTLGDPAANGLDYRKDYHLALHPDHQSRLYNR